MSVKNILISQQQPSTASPYTSIAEKFGVNFDFKPFYKISPLSSREFRAQRINILDHTAIVFSARSTIDAFFLLCEELRAFLVESVSKTGGHLASNLGAVEITVAIHRVFDTARDRLVFDVGHQCYIHKALTHLPESMPANWKSSRCLSPARQDT